MKTLISKTGKICSRCLEDLEEHSRLCFCKGYQCKSILCSKHDDKLCVDHRIEFLKKNNKLIYAITKINDVIKFFAKGIDTQTFLVKDVRGVEFSKKENIFTIYLKDETKILLFVESKEMNHIQSKWEEHWNVILDKEKLQSICFFEFESVN